MRQCGGCTLCCKLIPVEELSKPAGARCPHVRTGKGCSIYDRRPLSCREWSCMWLIGTEDEQPLDLRRPDHVHYVIDSVPDLVRARDDVTGEITAEITVMQVWCDPRHPDAWQDKGLLDMLERQGVVALIRYDSARGFAIFPPSRSGSGQWERSRNHETVADMGEARLRARFDFWRRQAFQQGGTPQREGEGRGSTQVSGGGE